MKQNVIQLLFMHEKNVETELDTEERNINLRLCHSYGVLLKIN